ncbi:TPA_asm: glycoside hydrolase family 19 protein [Salmonella enterica subsp. enterica serovar Newport]|uniref:Glycoside hydrolase family 19 protein n=2 Tax=Salmonella enterica TaxID=28901 RepID=A0A749YAA7_SALER|nr:glycoside hydrolase family 19 protein [Salmonella enterica]EAB8061032.1 glycoside hydrolase family 19 protein [Salmonella enterica subsp. enterica serovar Anatum]EBL5784923.1 glycoside hydrolase family 19 protein [Salmonella enterica subsp. enterica serovar Montevideo]EBX4440825.1 glycoside hydrolase family 19 protein [Salmonella enterica subsp. enterica serovar Newport]EEJ7372947.1 glycoside hydrolase family 19 protein [Salmonella enterica subsp. enterica]EBD9849372.1 glycoside hydrolase f
MNESQFQQAAGISAELAARWYPHITAAMSEFGITASLDQAMFLAQIGHESGGFTRIVENLNYSADGLKATFGKYFPGDTAQLYGRTADHPANQKAIANIVYAHRMGNIEENDGWNYRGRGLIQITGHDNYRDCGAGLGADLILSPQLLEQDEYAARSAAWFFASKGSLKRSGDIKAVTKIINGGTNGLDDRKARYEKAKSVLV